MALKDGLNVVIDQSRFDGMVGIYFVKKSGDEIAVADPVKLVFSPANALQHQEPSISLPYPLSEEIIKAFVQAASDSGVKTINENHLEGEMVATKAHLEDMRKLVFHKLDKE